MSKKEPKPEEKIAEGKKASKAAEKKARKNKINKEAKKLSDKQLLDMASEMPVGQANEFLKRNLERDKIDLDQEILNKRKRDNSAGFKAIKTDMAALARVRKLRKMDKEDMLAALATDAQYMRQLKMDLSPEAMAILKELDVKRENARAAMAQFAGEESGKETGSGMIGHNSDGEKGTQAEAEKEARESDEKVAALPTLPERNERLGAGFRVPDHARN